MSDPSRSPSAKAVRTRKAILDAASVIAAQHGAEAVTTTALAQACGMSVGTVYRYFADREAAIGAAFDRVSGELHRRWFEGLGDMTALSPGEAGQRMMDAHAALLDELPAYAPLLDAVRRVRPVAAADAQRSERAQSDLFAQSLGIATTPENRVRLDVLRTVTGALTVQYALAGDDRRLLLHDEVVRIASQSVEAMRTG